ncbi:MAG: sulfatase-like hydrolase/transferase [Sulfurimonas sp.]|nr:sulfatase-like hydrolase/transferase [Sulfurimonas sp.]
MNILKILTKYYLYMILIFFIGRLSLFILYFDNIQDTNISYWLTFLYGLRMDTMITSFLLVIPLITLSFTPGKFKNFANKFLKYYFVVVLSVLIYMENATFPFIAEYDVRPNYLFVEYLIYPKEVFSMILADYKVALTLAFSMIGVFAYLFLKYRKNDFLVVFETHYFKRILLFIPILLILFIGVRSSFGHRPANISDAMYSNNRALNEITKNSLYSVGYAMYINSRNGSKKIIKQYGKMDPVEALSRVKKRLGIVSINEKSPLSRLETTHFKTNKPKNLVIFVQESLGYQYVESVGGEKGITPNLNRLSKEGILFEDLYSNGTRSIRGLAGITAGNFSVPGKGVLKRNKSQSDFFSIASLLKPHGYYTSFIYGGESRFDNMKGWYLGNGFNEVIDQPKFDDKCFTGTWGVCDGDVVTRANEEFKNLYAKNKKFATVMFSTSSHGPYDFPDNTIELVNGVEKKSVENAIKYADFAIGKFIKLAKKEDYYKDTVFVVVADHNQRTYGKDMVPVNMFHIPGLILGKDIKPLVYDKISTQPDVLATALDLIGLDLQYPIMGHSIFSDKKKNISLMQFHSSYALRVDDKVAIIRPGKKPMTFLYTKKDEMKVIFEHLVKIESDVELEKDALAFVVALDYLYNNKLYK